MTHSTSDFSVAGAARTSDTRETAQDAETRAEVESVVDIALDMFARTGFTQTKLSAIANETGMSKRMIHYHFGDKVGLYTRAIQRALERLTPPNEILNRSYTVPVEGMRRFVDAVFHCVQDNPEAIHLLVRESIEPALTNASADTLHGENEVLLHIERLLLVGQDAGAFRPGISSHDVMLLIVSLSSFRATNGAISRATMELNMEETRNIEGMRRMVIDTVLAFLTSNISHSGYDSYLVPKAPSPSEETSVADELYYHS